MASKPIERQIKAKWSKPVLRKLEGKEAEEALRLMMARNRLPDFLIK